MKKISRNLNIEGKSVLLIGNRGYKNLGDELILLGNVKLLLEQGKKVILACNDPKWLQNFFSQFIDVNQIIFIQELPKGFRSLFKYIFKIGMRGFKYFWNVDTIILGGGEIITEENPSAYWYRIISIWPFFIRKLKKNNILNLYIMGGVQIPGSDLRKRLLKFLLKNTTSCYLRDFQSVEEISPYVKKCEFFMDTSYFAYDWTMVDVIDKKRKQKPYVVVNLNKNAECFFDELVEDIRGYVKKGCRVFFVPVAKGNNSYYKDLQYSNRLEKSLGDDVDFMVLDWESDFDNFVKILKGAEKIFSSRLHLYLISSFIGCDIKVYPYQRKILKMKEVIDKLG